MRTLPLSTKTVAALLDAHPNVKLHFTERYSSCRNQADLGLSKVRRDVLSRGVFTSIADLTRTLRRYIQAEAKQAKPFRWKYDNPARRIRHGKFSSERVHHVLYNCQATW